MRRPERVDGLDEVADPPYLVTHTPARAAVDRAHSGAHVLRRAGQCSAAGRAGGTLARRELGDIGLWLGLLPIVLATPFALPWLDPPAEHGALRLLAFMAQKATRSVLWLRLPNALEA